jgi:hypothetical protein
MFDHISLKNKGGNIGSFSCINYMYDIKAKYKFNILNV